jgi:aspartate ammonia-lyase
MTRRESPSRPETEAAAALYALSPYQVSPRLVRKVALVKEAAASCNLDLGYMSAQLGGAVIRAARGLGALGDAEIGEAFPLDAFQGGAGTSINMAVNEWIAVEAAEASGGVEVDAHAHVNLHQSTNDVVPTALRLLMHDGLTELETACEGLQSALQEGEVAFDGILKPARTQLREALVTSLGREFATWAHAVGRDRWRSFKARERIREVNLGGTAIGTGAGAPRRYVLQVVRYLQGLTDHPVSRAEHLGEATSNYDSILEAMEAPRSVAANLRRVASDLRLLASGPETAVGELRLPAPLAGSSIMAGKVNPVVPEAVIQSAERILADDALITRLASMSELELNAFLPAIAHTVDESLEMARRGADALADFVGTLVPDEERCSRNLLAGYAEAVALLPFVTYREVETLLAAARREGYGLRGYLEAHDLLSPEDANALFHPRNLTALGYDEELCAEVEGRSGAALRGHIQELLVENT